VMRRILRSHVVGAKTPKTRGIHRIAPVRRFGRVRIRARRRTHRSASRTHSSSRGGDDSGGDGGPGEPPAVGPPVARVRAPCGPSFVGVWDRKFVGAWGQDERLAQGVR
jgi:hypothetical protein